MAKLNEQQLLLLNNLMYYAGSAGKDKTRVEDIVEDILKASPDELKASGTLSGGFDKNPENMYEIAKAIAEDEALCRLEVVRSVNKNNVRASCFYDSSTDEAVVAVRGTGGSYDAWHDNFEGVYDNDTTCQETLLEFVNDLDYQNITITGHSKGGNFAVYASAFCDKEIQDRIQKVYSNDGPGFRDEILKTEGYQNILPRVISILPEESIVGVLLSNEYEHHIVKSSAKAINQHDPMTWQVLGPTFEEAKHRSEGSILFDKTMMTWLATMSDEDRAIFTDILFSSAESTGVTTLNEISEGGVKIISEIRKAIKDMPSERQQELSEMVKRLLRINSELLRADVKETAKLPKLPKMNLHHS